MVSRLIAPVPVEPAKYILQHEKNGGKIWVRSTADWPVHQGHFQDE
jgi:hypothetical protein